MDEITRVELSKNEDGDFIVDQLIGVSDNDPAAGCSTRWICNDLQEALKAVEEAAKELYE